MTITIARGRGRPCTWLSEAEFAEKHPQFIIPAPPHCICGNGDYRFTVIISDVCAACNACNATLIFNVVTDRWTRWNLGIPTNRKNRD